MQIVNLSVNFPFLFNVNIL